MKFVSLLTIALSLFSANSHATVSDCKVVKAASIEVKMILKQLGKKSDKTPAYNKAIDAWVRNEMLPRLNAYYIALSENNKSSKKGILGDYYHTSGKERAVADFAWELSSSIDYFINVNHDLAEIRGNVIIARAEAIIINYCEADVEPYGMHSPEMLEALGRTIKENIENDGDAIRKRDDSAQSK